MATQTQTGMVARYDGRCPACGQPITAGADRITKRGGRWVHVACPAEDGEAQARAPRMTAWTDGAVIEQAAADRADGLGRYGMTAAMREEQRRHPFKPDASAPTRPDARCAVCGTRTGVAWISGAGRYLCPRHQDEY